MEKEKMRRNDNIKTGICLICGHEVPERFLMYTSEGKCVCAACAGMLDTEFCRRNNLGIPQEVETIVGIGIRGQKHLSRCTHALHVIHTEEDRVNFICIYGDSYEEIALDYRELLDIYKTADKKYDIDNLWTREYDMYKHIACKAAFTDNIGKIKIQDSSISNKPVELTMEWVQEELKNTIENVGAYDENDQEVLQRTFDLDLLMWIYEYANEHNYSDY